MTEMHTVIVVGGGIAGLLTALTMAERGYEVTALEHDDVPMPPDVETAWTSWDRSGAPQARQPHVVLGRFCRVLRDKHPGVYQRLLDAGATEAPFMEAMHPESGYRPEPGDEDLVAVSCRRLTVEWVLRQAVLDDDRIAFRSGVTVKGLVAEGEVPHVTGVRLADGSELSADLTVVTSGKRTKVPDWYAAIGARPMPEETGESGIVYFSRFYRLPDGAEIDRTKPAIATGGFLRGGVFEADNRTFSVSVVAANKDTELRRLLLEPGRMERVIRALPHFQPVAQFLSEPISEVSAMAGVSNRWRGLIVDGTPLATGVVPLGDTLVQTNPAYGWGMSAAAWEVDLLNDALDKHSDDPTVLVMEYAQAVEGEIKPWYDESCQRDAANQRIVDAVLAGKTPPDNAVDFTRLIELSRYDAVVRRAFAKVTNMLCSPSALLEDADLLSRVAALMQRPCEKRGRSPGRKEIIALLRADTTQNKDMTV